MSIQEVSRPDNELVIVKYNKPNESFTSKLEVFVNGHQAVFMDGRWALAPWFLVRQAQQCYQLSHRQSPNDDDNDESFPVYANLDIREVSKDYQSPEGAQKLLAEAKKITDTRSPYYKLYGATKNFVFGDLTPQEKKATDQVNASGNTAIVNNSAELNELKAEIKAKDAEISKQGELLEAIMEKMNAMEKEIKKPAPKSRAKAKTEAKEEEPKEEEVEAEA